MTAARTFAEGDRVAVTVLDDGYGRRTLLGTVNLPYTRHDGSPGRTIEVVLDTPLDVDDGVVRVIYTTADRLRPVTAPVPLELVAPIGGRCA